MKMHNLNSKDFILDEIESIELIGDRLTVDITVEDTHMFFANDVYSHNSSLEEDVIDASKVSESYGKVMVADFIISLSRKVHDKLAGTGRWHVIKNRFGPDGITMPSKMDTSNGRFDIYVDTTTEGKNINRDMRQSDTLERKYLKDRYQDFLDFG